MPPVLRRSDIYQWVVHGVDPNFLDGSVPPGSHSDGTMLPERHLGTRVLEGDDGLVGEGLKKR